MRVWSCSALISEIWGQGFIYYKPLDSKPLHLLDLKQDLDLMSASIGIA